MPRWPAWRSRSILGIPLSARLVRRLRRLREAALELAQGGPTVRGPGGPRPRRGRRPGPDAGDHAAAAAPAGGGPARLRGHRVARAAHAADLAGRDARAAARRSQRRWTPTSRMPGRWSSARTPSRGGSGGWPPTCSTCRASTPRCSCAPSRWSSASSAGRCWPSSSSAPSAATSAPRSRTRRRGVGPRGPRQHRPDPAHPARQRRPGQPARVRGRVSCSGASRP